MQPPFSTALVYIDHAYPVAYSRQFCGVQLIITATVPFYCPFVDSSRFDMLGSLYISLYSVCVRVCICLPLCVFFALFLPLLILVLL